MALASAPSTPERTILTPSIRRSFTAPIKSSRSTVPIPEGHVHGAETLYAHDAGKIISFTHSSHAGRRHSSVSNGRAEFQDESVGTLPWASATERTIAAGSLRIYRVLGSVAFLNSGVTLRPLLAKSQCWCVDGESKFVLRIRPYTYYRIELPSKTSEDKIKVEELKTVLCKILQYEVTPCPFKRGFTVDLPDLPRTPIQKRPWRPKTQSTITPEHERKELGRFDYSLQSPRSQFPAAEQDTNGRIIGHAKRERRNDVASSSDVSNAESENEVDGEVTVETETSPQELDDDTRQDMLELKTPTRPKSLKTGRAITAPPQLTLRITPPSGLVTNAPSLSERNKESPSLSSSMDSFHSFHSPISPLAPSPDFPNLDSLPLEAGSGLDIPRTRGHKRDVSEATVTAGSSELWDMSSARSHYEDTHDLPRDTPGTPPLIDDAASEDEDHWSEAVTPSPSKEIRRRRYRSRRRSQSPLPANVNLYSPYSPRAHVSGHHLTTAILQRTCSLLLGPPVQLVALMLRIAAKITKGAFRGSSIGFGENGQKIPCSWDFSDSSDDNGEEDDYGVPLSRPASRNVRATEVAGSWEID